jgi:hypothetical protein
VPPLRLPCSQRGTCSPAPAQWHVVAHALPYLAILQHLPTGVSPVAAAILNDPDKYIGKTEHGAPPELQVAAHHARCLSHADRQLQGWA